MKKFPFKPLITIAVLVAMYVIWPDPFWYISRKIILPTGEKISDAAKIVFSPFSIFLNIDDLVKQNDALEKENTSLKAQLAKISDNEHYCQISQQEADSLSGLFPESSLLVGRIKGRQSGSYDQIIITDKGSQDGLKGGEAITYSGALIGVVGRVYSNESEVKLITNYNSVVPIVTEKSREIGLIRGGLGGVNAIDIPSSAKISVGEKVLTSGLGGDLPSGIFVGTVESITGSEGVFLSAKLALPVDLKKIEVLTIIKK